MFVQSVIASPRRCEILRLTWHGPVRAGDIHRAMPEVSFGAVSQHLKSMVADGVLNVHREGRCRYYEVSMSALGGLTGFLEAQWDDVLYRLKIRAELDARRRGPRSENRP